MFLRRPNALPLCSAAHPAQVTEVSVQVFQEFAANGVVVLDRVMPLKGSCGVRALCVELAAWSEQNPLKSTQQPAAYVVTDYPALTRLRLDVCPGLRAGCDSQSARCRWMAERSLSCAGRQGDSCSSSTFKRRGL
jgi:hypothetical protein